MDFSKTLNVLILGLNSIFTNALTSTTRMLIKIRLFKWKNNLKLSSKKQERE